MVNCKFKKKKMKNLNEFGFNTKKRTYTIAEIGIIHNGDVNTAKELIKSASKTGVDSVKFQTYLTEKRAPKDSPIFDILKKCELPFDKFLELKNYSNQLGLDFFSTPFDDESVDYLESIGVDFYKIASFDITNFNLLQKIAKTNKPIIMSVGMSNLNEINSAYDFLKNYNDKIALLHCVSSYPTIETDSNISAIHELKRNFENCVIGQSDHTNDI